MDFDEISHLICFRKSVEKSQVSLKYDEWRVSYMETYVHLWYVAELFLKW